MIRNYQMLKEQINYAIQNSELDIGAAYFIVKDVFQTLEKMYYAHINTEFMEESKKNKEEEEDVVTKQDPPEEKEQGK
ncbi:hypothetical protein D7X25_15615 [bacterium 1XD42-8]|nr:hypothetical protein D7X25_15615 [bacterium 1XD42-8]